MQWTNHFWLLSQQSKNFFLRFFSLRKKARYVNVDVLAVRRNSRIKRINRMCVCFRSPSDERIRAASATTMMYDDRLFALVVCDFFFSIFLYLLDLAFCSIQFAVCVCVCYVFLIPTRFCFIELKFIPLKCSHSTKHTHKKHSSLSA